MNTEQTITEWHDTRLPDKGDKRIVAAKLAEEVGEVCGATIKIEEGRAHFSDLIDEMGDVLIVMSVLAGRMNWTLEEIRDRRWKTVSQR